MTNKEQAQYNRDLTNMCKASDYTLRYLARHLSAAGMCQDLHKLLVGNRAWMEAKFLRLHGDSAYIADLELALDNYSDPLSPDKLAELTELYTMRQVVNQRVRLYTNHDLKTLVWLGRQEEALSQARLRSETGERFEGLWAIYEVLLKQDRPDAKLFVELHETARQIEDTEKQGEALGDLVNTLAKTRIFDQAKTITESITHLSWQAVAQCTLASALAEAGHTNEVLAILRELPEKVANIQDTMARSIARSILALLFSEIGHVEEAQSTFQQCDDDIKSIKDALTLVNVLSIVSTSLIQSGDTDKARTMYEQARIAARSIEIETMRAYVLNVLVARMSENGEFEKAQVVAYDIEYEWLRISALSSVATALVKVGRIEDALQIFEELQSLAEESDDIDEKDTAFGALAPALIEAKYFEWGLTIAGRISDPLKRIATFSEAAAKLATAGRLDQAKQVFEQGRELLVDVEDFKARVDALSAVAANLAKAGYIAKARQILERAQKLLNDLENSAEYTVACQALIDALICAEGFEQAQKFIDGIPTDKNRDSVLYTLTLALIEAGKLEQAYAIASSMQGISIDETRATMFKTMIVALVNSGDVEKANALTGSIQDNYDSMFPTFESALNQMTQLQKARKFSDSFRKMQVDIHSTLALALNKTGYVDYARDNFEQAQYLISCIEGSEMKAESLGILAVALTKAELIDAAQDTFEELRHLILHLNDIESQDVVRLALATALVRILEFEKAKTIAQKIQDVERRTQALSTLAFAFIDKDDLATAQTVIETLENAEIRAAALHSLATAFFTTDQPVKALKILGACTINEFISIIGAWGDVINNRLEHTAVGEPPSVLVQKSIIRIAGWKNSSWQEIYNIVR